MVRLALVGLGKMGLSHLSIVRAHPEVNLVGVCDPSKFMLELLGKNAGLETFTDLETMIEKARPEAIVVATPSRFHGEIVRVALERGIHVFCEKPFCLDWKESTELAELAERKALVNQVGYHYRFVAAVSGSEAAAGIKCHRDSDPCSCGSLWSGCLTHSRLVLENTEGGGRRLSL